MQCRGQLLPQSRGIYYITSHHIMLKAIPALTFGLAIGLFSSTAMQKWLVNPQAIATCNKPGIRDTHRVITISSVVGDTKYCIHTYYLAN